MDPYDLIRDGKIRRYFRATRKLNAPDFVYHITQRAAGKEPLFLEDDDYLFMLVTLKEISHTHNLRIHAFCLMPSHVHLLLSPAEENLYDAMRDLFSRYAMKFNRKYERKGHLFGAPYRQAVCLDDSYLLAASLYIHLNPVKAGLVRDPFNYRWSSSRLYCQHDSPSSFVNPDFILGVLAESEAERKETYRQLLKRGSRLEIGHVLEKEDAIERFSLDLASIFPFLFKKAGRGMRAIRTSKINLLSIEELETKIEEMKRGALPNKPETRKAKKYLVEQLIARGYKRGEIAERLGVSRKTIYNLLKSSM